MVIKNNSGKKLMIKVETNLGYFTIKHYDDNIDNILNDEDYINGRDDVNNYKFHKVSFYLIYFNLKQLNEILILYYNNYVNL